MSLETKTQTPTKKQRQAGFELLRIIAMLLIVFIHLYYQGEYNTHTNNAFNQAAFNILHALSTFSVNVFILISAYFNVKVDGFKPRRLIRLWCETFFYCLTLYLVSVIVFHDEFRFIELISCFFPIVCAKYWFFTAYFLLMLLAPFINKMLNNCSLKECILLVILIFALSYFAGRLPIDNRTELYNGLNLPWFICLYIIGGILRLYPTNLKRRYWFIIGLACVALLVGELYVKNHLPEIVTLLLFNEYNYTSPLVVILSVATFMFFSDIDVKNEKVKKCINFISASMFGVYLFHITERFMNHLFFDVLSIQCFYDVSYNVLYVITFMFIILAMGIVVDLVRRLIFYYFEKGIDGLINKAKEKRQNGTESQETEKPENK